MTFGRDLLMVSSLAAADYRHESRLSLCQVAALAAVLTPLLVLFGLRYGIVTTLREELRHNPTTLELRPLVQGSYGRSFFAELENHTGTAFLLPNTRFLAATVTLRNPAARLAAVDSELIPTAPGDPLLQHTVVSQLTTAEVVLSQTAAEKLRVGVGDELEGRLGRVVADRHETVHFPLRVRAVIPVALYARDAAFVALPLLLMAEDYREGFSVPDWQADGRDRAPGERLFAGFRLYARSIDDVGPLRDWLAAREIDTDTRLAEIGLVQRLDRSLTILFLIIACLGGIGFCLSLAISLWGNVERKRYELSVFRLLGLPSVSLAAFPIVQAGLTGLFGSLLAGVCYALTSPTINALFAEGLSANQVLCRLPVTAFLWAVVLTLVLATAAAAAGWHAARFSPAEGLRYE